MMIADFIGIATADVMISVYQHQHLVFIVAVVQFFTRRDVLLLLNVPIFFLKQNLLFQFIYSMNN